MHYIKLIGSVYFVLTLGVPVWSVVVYDALPDHQQRTSGQP